MKMGKTMNKTARTGRSIAFIDNLGEGREGCVCGEGGGGRGGCMEKDNHATAFMIESPCVSLKTASVELGPRWKNLCTYFNIK